MADFNVSSSRVIQAEGKEYTNAPNDKGGPTKYGWTEKRLRECGYVGDVKNLSLDLALKMYEEFYWHPLNLDMILCQPVADELLDISVNQGTVTAGKTLQYALNLLNRNGETWPDIDQDGIVGTKTLSILNNLTKADQSYVYITTRGIQFMRYIQIATKDSTQEEWFRGWLNRSLGQLRDLTLMSA